MSPLPVSLDDLQRIVALFESHRLTELELCDEEFRVRLRSSEPRATTFSVAPAAEELLEEWTGEMEAVTADTVSPSPADRGWTVISAPMTGTFYRSPGPDEPNFTEVGNTVEADQVIGLIEAMKIFSEIRAEAPGVVMDLPVAGGEMAQPGQPLAWILPHGPVISANAE